MKTKQKIEIILFIVSLLIFLWLKFDYRIAKNQSFYEFPHLSIEISNNKNIIFGNPVAPIEKILHYTGYSSGYDYDTKNSLWVSYNLRSKNFNGKKFLRRRNFRPSPDIKSNYSQTNNIYRKTGYDRGHLAKQEDMKGRNIECELESCYLNNISPQKKKFNRGIWKRLEDKCHVLLVKNDEAWIITGPIFDTNHTYLKYKTEIPDAFYKIIVLRKNNSLEFISFIIPQNYKTTNLTHYLTSIDKIESSTGIDFFPLMNKSTETKIEQNTFKEAL